MLKAEEAPYHPQPFTEAHRVAHGSVQPIGTNAIYLDANDRCKLTVSLYGWEASQCGQVDGVFMGMGSEIDTLLVAAPVTDGHVKLDDWTSNVSGEVEAITESYKQGLAAQSKVLGKEIRFVGWSR